MHLEIKATLAPEEPQQLFGYVLASADRFAKNVVVLAVVIAGAELGYVERKILFAGFVEGAHHVPLNRPETGRARRGRDGLIRSLPLPRHRTSSRRPRTD